MPHWGRIQVPNVMEIEDEHEEDEQVLGYVLADLGPCMDEAMLTPGTVLEARVRRADEVSEHDRGMR